MDSMAYLKDFRGRIQNNDYPGFLKIWEEYCHGDQPDGEEMVAILESVKKSELAKPFGLQVERAIPIWRLLPIGEFSHAVLRLILDLQTTNSEQLADLATEYLKERNPEDPLFNEKLRLVGLRNRERFQGCIRDYELLTHLKEGNFVFHSAGWGTGEITSVSLVREELSLEFEHVLGIQTLSFDKAFKTLIPLEKTHFYSKRFGNPDDLEKTARENPTEVIRKLLHDLGPKNAAEIKEEMIDLVIPADEWNRWWQTTRAKLKKDTKIECPKDLKDPFHLREKELPHEMAFHKALEENPGVHSTIQMTYAFLRDFTETLKNSEFKASLVSKISEMLQHEHMNDAQRLSLLLLLSDLDVAQSENTIREILSQMPKIADLVRSIDIAGHQKRILQIAAEARKDWANIFLDLLLTIDQNSIRDYLVTELNGSETKDALKKKINDLLIHPISYPEAFIWYFQKVMDKKSKLPFSDKEGKNLFFEGLLILLDHLEQKPQSKDLTKKVLNLIIDDRYAIVREILQQSKIEEVKEYLLLASKCGSFADHDIKILHSLAEVVHPSLSRLRKDKDQGKTPENIIWTTQEGYQKAQSRIQQIATVETVQNAKEIEAARALGDLRENAEFKAALERRDRLQSELKFFSDQIAQARILTPEDIAPDEVGVGSVVSVRDSKGEHLKFTLLGPWDADPEKRILSFQSKIAQAMKGRTVGEKFTFQGEEFTILDINSYFDQKK
ncbi:MAG TPA: GreA/GreB family elongation factor [Chlamydiales bacterium]|nr:GreA/GreB family elongation factor [Chlamydiales bacterium]